MNIFNVLILIFCLILLMLCSKHELNIMKLFAVTNGMLNTMLDMAKSYRSVIEVMESTSKLLDQLRDTAKDREKVQQLMKEYEDALQQMHELSAKIIISDTESDQS